jgi:hypothetical protein
MLRREGMVAHGLADAGVDLGGDSWINEKGMEIR